MRLKAILVVLTLLSVITLCVADESLESLFRGHAHEMRFESGVLSGPGMEFLSSEAAESQYLCLAEPHNTQQIPQIVTALFTQLQDAGSADYLAIEQGPAITQHIVDLAKTLDNASLRKRMKKRKKALHFKTAEEIEMIADVARASKGSLPGVWGLDRVLDAKFVENWLTSPERRDDPESAFIKERIEWSTRNVAMYSAKKGSEDWLSADQHREDGFKTGFQHYFEKAKSEDGKPPRVMFRFGHTHMGRVDYPKYPSLGRYLNELAQESGSRAFHLNLQSINRPGEYWSLTDYPDYEPLANVGDPSKWIVIDLRPAREFLRNNDVEISKKLKRMVFNFDAVLLIGGLSKGSKL